MSRPLHFSPVSGARPQLSTKAEPAGAASADHDGRTPKAQEVSFWALSHGQRALEVSFWALSHPGGGGRGPKRRSLDRGGEGFAFVGGYVAGFVGGAGFPAEQ